LYLIEAVHKHRETPDLTLVAAGIALSVRPPAYQKP
jgi:hypothetical protein